MLRSALEIGPAKVTHLAHNFYAKEASALDIEPEIIRVGTDRHGPLDDRIVDMLGRLSITPDGAWTSAARAALYPYANTKRGASLGGQGSIIIHCDDGSGNRYTGKAAVLTRMPQLLLSSRQTMMGPAEYTLIREDNKAPNEADSFIVRDTAVFADSALTVASLKTQAYTGAYGSSIVGIETEEGWTVDFALGVVLKRTDRWGTIDIRFDSLQVTASCVPVNIGVDDILEAIRAAGPVGWTAGQSMQAAGQAFTLTGEDASVPVTLANAYAQRGQIRFGATDYRQGGISFVSTRVLSAGANTALFTLA